MSRRYPIIALSLLLSPLFGGEPFTIDLKDPIYQNGEISTEKGGVITAPALRIQADQIHYLLCPSIGEGEGKILASGNLLMVYDDQIFVGDQIEFDLATGSGFLTQAKAKAGAWYVGGTRIELRKQGHFVLFDPFLTTSVGDHNYWEVRAKNAEVTEGHLLRAKEVSFRVFGVPILKVPYLKSNLERRKDPSLRYRLLWDKGIGPRLSVRYRFYSTDTLSAFARLDYRFTLGPGAALEAEYISLNERVRFRSRNYASLDQSFDQKGKKKKGERSKEFRFQGLIDAKSDDQRTCLHAQWDRFSSLKMIGTFKEFDFEVNTQKVSYLTFFHYQDMAFTDLSFRPQLNEFDTVNQELPQAVFGIRPFSIGKTGIVMENYANVASLDYTYGKGVLPHRSSSRLQTTQSLYRPLSLWGITCVPRAGLTGIYYGNSPKYRPIGQLVYNYGGDLSLRFARSYSQITHTAIPYASYVGYTRPQAPLDQTFIFDLYDGYFRYDQLRFGLRQLFFDHKASLLTPLLSCDLYGYAFWGARSFSRRIPKLFAIANWQRPSYSLSTEFVWNVDRNLVDLFDIRYLWTVNASVALSAQWRYRSAFWWRKAVFDDFTLDCARPLDQLLLSPLSDKRSTLLGKIHFRFSPRWNLHLHAYHGWGRLCEPNYSGLKADLYTMLTGNWQMRLSYEYMPNDPFRFSYEFKLLN